MGAKIQPIQTNFNGGLFSSHLMGRTDVEKYFTAASTMENFIPTIQGPAVRRPGRRLMAPAMNLGRLLPFQLSNDQAYVLEISEDGRMRFYTQNGQILLGYAFLTQSVTLISGIPADIPLSTVANMPASGHVCIGQQVECSYVSMSGVTPGTVNGVQALYMTATTTFPSGTIVTWPYELQTPYVTAPFGGQDDLWDIQTAQSNDVMYMAHPNHPVAKLNRLNDTDWIITYPSFHPPPMDEIPVDMSVGNGLFVSSVNASSGNVFLPGDVGKALVAGIGLAYITQMISSSVVALQTVDPFDQTYYPSGSWFLKGGPSSYFSLGLEDTSSGTKVWKSSRQLGAGPIQTAFTFSKFPQDNIAPPPIMDSFRGSDTGRYITSGGAVMQILQVNSASEVTVLMLSPVTDTYTDTNGVIRATPQSGGDWNMEDPNFTPSRGYPRAVAFFQDRLWLASSTSEPQTLYGSVTSDYENFSKGAQDTDSLQLTINNGRQDTAEWMNPFQGLLITGTFNGEYAIGAGQAVVGGNGPAITPTNATSMVQSSYGVNRIKPILVENQMLYVQRGRYNVYEMAFSIYTSVLASTDLNVYATLDTTEGAKELIYQQYPWRVVWLLTMDGQLWGLTYKKDGEVEGWHTSVTGNNDFVCSIATIPEVHFPQPTSDGLYLLVAHTVGGNTVYFIEHDDSTLNTDCASQAVFGSPVGQIGGLNYLTGVNVDVKVDGAYYGSQQVSANGTVAINPPGLNVEVGLPYTSTLLTNRLAERGGANIQGLLKKWNTLWVRVANTLGVKVNGSRVMNRRPSDNMNGPVPLFSGDVDAKAMPGNNREGQILIEQDQPFPCEVQAIFGQVNVGEI